MALLPWMKVAISGCLFGNLKQSARFAPSCRAEAKCPKRSGPNSWIRGPKINNIFGQFFQFHDVNNKKQKRHHLASSVFPTSQNLFFYLPCTAIKLSHCFLWIVSATGPLVYPVVRQLPNVRTCRWNVSPLNSTYRNATLVPIFMSEVNP